MRTPRVNETKVTSKNAFTENVFTFESEKETKNEKRNFFSDYPEILDLAVNP